MEINTKHAVALAVILLFAAGCSKPENSAQPMPGSWPEWRGAKGTGVSEETGLPVRWSADNATRWAVKLPGTGISSPIVGNDVVYVTYSESERDVRGAGTKLALLALDLKTGETLWKTDVARRQREKLHQYNRPAAATPATDGQTIYVYFGSHLGAVSTTGKLLWVKDIDKEYLRYSRYGAGSSLVLMDDSVIVFRDREDAGPNSGYLVAYSKAAGDELWRKQWDDSCCSYATPLRLDFAGEPELLVIHAQKMISYDAKTGERLWQRELNINQPVASPVVENDFLCVASGAHFVREMSCWRLSFDGRERSVENLWRGTKTVPGTASPLLYNGLFFTIHEKGFTRAYDPETGEELWRARLTQGGYHGSPVAAEDRIYAISLAGTVSAFSAIGGRFKLLGESPLPDGNVVASPAIANGCLIVRTAEYLYCVDGGQSNAGDGDAAPS